MSRDVIEPISRSRKDNNAANVRRASFTSFVVSVDGALGLEATYYLKQHICLKWEKSYGEVMGWLRASLTFTIMRATILCLRGSRVKWRSALDMVDGIGLPSIQE